MAVSLAEIFATISNGAPNCGRLTTPTFSYRQSDWRHIARSAN